MVPLAFGLDGRCRIEYKLAARLGTTNVVTAGLMSARWRFSTTLAWSPRWRTGRSGCGSSSDRLGWAGSWAPATDSVMGAVPEEKAGVASAMNDVARQVAGALGVAVIGSLVASLYSSRVEDATGALPAEQATAASDSVGAAVAIADGLPGSAGAALEHAAANAYTEALGLGLLAAAAVALTGAAVVSRLLPAHHRPVEPARKAPLAAAPEGAAIAGV